MPGLRSPTLRNRPDRQGRRPSMRAAAAAFFVPGGEKRAFDSLLNRASKSADLALQRESENQLLEARTRIDAVFEPPRLLAKPWRLNRCA